MKTMTLTFGMTLTALALATTALTTNAPQAVADPAPRPYALTLGHMDLFEITYADGGLKLSLKEDSAQYATGTQYRDPSEVEVFVDSALAATQVPDNPNLAFLGNPGDTIYLLPQTQDADLPWPGWSTERLKSTLPDGISLPSTPDVVEATLDVTGPGDVLTWMSGTFGAPINRYIDTTDAAPDVIPIEASAHVHTNWAFTALGDYHLTVTPTATTTAGGELTGPAEDYLIHVGPAGDAAPHATSAPAISGTPTVGQQLSVSPGAWAPLPHLLTYQWQRDGQPIPGATSAAYVPTAADAGHQVRALVTAGVGTVSAAVPTAALTVAAPEVSQAQQALAAATATANTAKATLATASAPKPVKAYIRALAKVTKARAKVKAAQTKVTQATDKAAKKKAKNALTKAKKALKKANQAATKPKKKAGAAGRRYVAAQAAYTNAVKAQAAAAQALAAAQAGR